MDKNVTEKTTAQLIEPLKNELGALLPILHALQDHFGYVPRDSVPTVAKALNLSRAEVHGVISFYHWFKKEPGGKHTLYICRAESCQAMGSKALEQSAKAQLGIDYHETSADGQYSLEPIYCLGNCACSPSIMIDERLYSRVTPDSLSKILDGKQ
ncbi:MAG: formate dehydrogenase subunit gamma [Halioglobus sp.]|jgi:formate dehydrogenase subunit gamma